MIHGGAPTRDPATATTRPACRAPFRVSIGPTRHRALTTFASLPGPATPSAVARAATTRTLSTIPARPALPAATISPIAAAASATVPATVPATTPVPISTPIATALAAVVLDKGTHTVATKGLAVLLAILPSRSPSLVLVPGNGIEEGILRVERVGDVGLCQLGRKISLSFIKLKRLHVLRN